MAALHSPEAPPTVTVFPKDSTRQPLTLRPMTDETLCGLWPWEPQSLALLPTESIGRLANPEGLLDRWVKDGRYVWGVHIGAPDSSAPARGYVVLKPPKLAAARTLTSAFPEYGVILHTDPTVYKGAGALATTGVLEFAAAAGYPPVIATTLHANNASRDMIAATGGVLVPAQKEKPMAYPGGMSHEELWGWFPPESLDSQAVRALDLHVGAVALAADRAAAGRQRYVQDITIAYA